MNFLLFEDPSSFYFINIITKKIFYIYYQLMAFIIEGLNDKKYNRDIKST